jgi:hypothetical protein
MLRLTTPVAYITSVPKSPFKETNIGYPGWPNPASGKNCTRMNSYLYVRAENCPPITTDASPADGLDDNYNTDRGVYIGGGIPAVVLAVRSSGSWMLKSVGPDNRDDRDAAQNPAGATTARVYDPTNGTVSPGDVVVFSDTQGFAQQR